MRGYLSSQPKLVYLNKSLVTMDELYQYSLIRGSKFILSLRTVLPVVRRRSCPLKWFIVQSAQTNRPCHFETHTAFPRFIFITFLRMKGCFNNSISSIYRIYEITLFWLDARVDLYEINTCVMYRCDVTKSLNCTLKLRVHNLSFKYIYIFIL